MAEPRKKGNDSSVLEDRTSRLLFSGSDSYLSNLDPVQAELENMARTPLSDVSAINSRLDAIGELVYDDALRSSFSAIASALEPSRISVFYSDLAESLKHVDRRGVPSYYWERVRNGIKQIAEAGAGLPALIGHSGYKSEIIADLGNEFDTLMKALGTDVKAFFECFSQADAALTALESAFMEKKEARNRSAKEEDAAYLEAWKANARSQGASEDDIDSEVRAAELLQSLGRRISPSSANEVNEPPVLEWIVQNFNVKKSAELAVVFSKFTPVYKGMFIFSSLAQEAVDGNYVRPEVVEKSENCLIIKGGRYLSGSSENVIPNPTELTGSVRVEVLEGVNDGGKTFDMRKALYIAARALAGMWVPAEYAKVSVRDKIILRMKGRGDTISALQQDCRSATECLPPSGEYWLAGMDETFRSTEAHGGEMLTAGFIDSVVEQGSSLLVISSHYPDLSHRYLGNGAVQFNHFAFVKSQDSEGKQVVTFPHVKHAGPLNDYSYALEVARSKSFNPQVLAYAQERIASRRANQ